MEGERKEERGEGKRGSEIRKGNKIIESKAGRKRRRKREERGKKKDMRGKGGKGGSMGERGKRRETEKNHT